MSVEENMATLRRAGEAVFYNRDMSVVPELIAPNYIYHSPFGEFKGVDGYIQMVTITLNAFPDYHMTLEDIVAAGDKVAVRFRSQGTFKGKFGDIEPTGKKIDLSEAIFYRFEGGKEVEAWPYTDLLAFYQQLGVSPPSQ